MSNTNTPAIDDIDFLTDEIERAQKEAQHLTKAYTRKVDGKKIKVRSGVEVARDEFKRRKATAKKEIRRLRRMIKLQRMQIKQARATYKIIKLSSK